MAIPRPRARFSDPDASFYANCTFHGSGALRALSPQAVQNIVAYYSIAQTGTYKKKLPVLIKSRHQCKPR